MLVSLTVLICKAHVGIAQKGKSFGNASDPDGNRVFPGPMVGAPAEIESGSDMNARSPIYTASVPVRTPVLFPAQRCSLPHEVPPSVINSCSIPYLATENIAVI